MRVRATIVDKNEQYALRIMSVYVALGIQNAKRMRRIKVYIVICGLSSSTVMFHTSS
jgi:hypothetical protein